jgi:hypothetical protein
MPNPDEWCREVEEILFGNDAADSRRRPVEEVADFPPPDVPPRRAVPIDTLDAALFGAAALSGSTATEVQEPDAVHDIAPAESEFVLHETEMLTAPPVMPLIVDEDDQVFDAPEFFDDGDAPSSTTNERGRGRVWAVAALALAVVVGTGLGAVALTRSSDSPPAVHTDSEGTTTTTATTIPATTIPATTTPTAPLTAPPAQSAPSPVPTTRPAPTTTVPRAPRVPGPAPTEPPPPEPPPPPPPPPPEPPPPPPPPTTSAPPPTTSLLGT